MADTPDSNNVPITLPALLLLDRYRVEEALGEGGLGTVIKAFDTRLKRRVAIKTLKRPIDFDLDQFRSLEERFAREAEASSRMGIHPNLVAVHDFVTGPDRTQYLILEFIAGGTLGDRLKEGPLPPADCIRWTIDIAEGLRAAHDVGIIHRDIKPANIFIATDGRARVGDFGIAQIDDISGRTRATTGHPGTPLYMSPEQAHSTGYVRPVSDQYSLGLVLFEMLTGVAYKRLGDREADTLLANQRPDMAALVRRMLQRDPEDRYPSLNAAMYDMRLIQRRLEQGPGNLQNDTDTPLAESNMPADRTLPAVYDVAPLGEIEQSKHGRIVPVSIAIFSVVALLTGGMFALLRYYNGASDANRGISTASSIASPSAILLATATKAPVTAASQTPVSAIAPTIRPTVLSVTPSGVAGIPSQATLPAGSARPGTPAASTGGTPGTGNPVLPIKRFTITNTDGAGVNMRDKPDVASKLVQTVPEGTEVQATGPAVDGTSGGTWYQVQVGDKTGYIRTDFLKAVGP